MKNLNQKELEQISGGLSGRSCMLLEATAFGSALVGWAPGVLTGLVGGIVGGCFDSY